MPARIATAFRAGAGLMVMCLGAFGQSLFGQSKVASVELFTHATDNFQKSVAFYQDIFGLEIDGPSNGPSVSQYMQDVTGIPGGKFRSWHFKDVGNSGFMFGLVEYVDLPKAHYEPNKYDPGAPTLLLRVRDMDTTLAALRKAGAKFVSKNGEPVRQGGPQAPRAVFVRDLDGFLLEIIEVSKDTVAAAPGSSPVVSMSIGITATSVDKALPFYNGLLGLNVQPNAKLNDTPQLRDLVDITSGGVRSGSVQIGSTPAHLSLYAFEGMKKTPVIFNPADPGASVLLLNVTDVKGLLEGVEKAGGKIMTPNAPIHRGGRPDGAPTAFIRDPDGLIIQLIQVKQ